MRDAGLDVHKREFEAVCLEADGRVGFRVRCPTTREALAQLGRRLGPEASSACSPRGTSPPTPRPSTWPPAPATDPSRPRVPLGPTSRVQVDAIIGT